MICRLSWESERERNTVLKLSVRAVLGLCSIYFCLGVLLEVRGCFKEFW